MTKHERAVKFLLNKGLVEIPSKSGKYRTFKSKDYHNLYFIGKKGAVRFGKCSSKSHSITKGVHERINALESK